MLFLSIQLSFPSSGNRTPLCCGESILKIQMRRTMVAPFACPSVYTKSKRVSVRARLGKPFILLATVIDAGNDSRYMYRCLRVEKEEREKQRDRETLFVSWEILKIILIRFICGHISQLLGKRLRPTYRDMQRREIKRADYIL